MDDRQQQIQVGAGLQESRLNTDLINFLEKWGTWILTAVLVVVAGYVGWSKYREYNAAKHDEAFDQYVAARGLPGLDGTFTGSPDNLLRIAGEHSSRGAVAHLARLDAAEIYLACARRGLRPGTNLGAAKPEDALNPDETTNLITQSRQLFQQVAADTASSRRHAFLHLRAKWGLYAAALSAGDADGARRTLTEIESLAAKSGIPEQAAQAKKRAEQLDALAAPPVLLSDADLPAVAAAPAPAPEALPPGVSVSNPEGLKIERMPEGFVPPGFEGNPGTPDSPQPQPPADPAAAPPQEQPKQPEAPAPAPQQPNP